jgi:all-beta uncharacterized protein
MRRLAVASLLALAAASVLVGEPGPAHFTKTVRAVSSASFTPGGRADSRLTVSMASASAAAACTPTETTYCANNGRFAVQIVFSAPNLQIFNAPAHAASLTSDTGYFWFFSPNNVEVVVKVVDGRAFNGFYWVFYGALSNVAYTVTVTDTQTGASKTYTNAAGTLASVADTAAFAGVSTCTYTVGAPTPASYGSSGGTGTVAITTSPGCSWTAVSNSAFITVASGASGTGDGSVTFNVAANPSGSSRTGSLTVGGELVTITQAGTSSGEFDGTWNGTTSQTCAPSGGSAHLCALRWVISDNAFRQLQVGFAGPACGVLDAFTSVLIDPPQPIVGNTFQLSTSVSATGVAATIMLNGRFDSTTSATGSGSVRITTSSPNPDCSTTVPIGITTAN